MAVIISDPEPGFRLPPPADFVQPSIRQQLSKPFTDDACFYVLNGRPCVVYPDCDYAEDWSAYPVREIHPLGPIIDGQEVTETEFRQLVRAMHAIARGEGRR